MTVREQPDRRNEVPEGQLVGSSSVGPTRYRPSRPEEQRDQPNRRGYYGLPILKRPLWRWEVWSYFFFGGLAGGSFVVASLAKLFGSPRDQIVSRVGYVVAFLALLFCPPLLIKDLGRPSRFVNMLRVVKPESPMSMGVWGLVSFSLFSTLAFFGDTFAGAWGPVGWIARRVPGRVVAAAGIPFACFLASYTGVLLSVTSIPIWARSRLIGATFLASAVSSSVSAVSLVLALGAADDGEARRKLATLERAAALAEAGALAGYLYQARRAAKPLVDPRASGVPFLVGTVGLGLALPILGGLVGHGERGRLASALLACAGLIGGVCLRGAFVEGGQASADDVNTYLWMTDEPVR